MFWLSAQSPRALLAFLTAHAPEGARETSSGWGEDNGRPVGWWERLDVPTTAPLGGPREVYIEIARAPGQRSAVRFDAVVAWHLPRPADSLIPTSARWLKATVTQRTSLFKTHSKRRTLHTVVEAHPSVVAAVAQAVNALPLAEPAGPSPSCPAVTEPPPFVHLTFRALASSTTLARVLVERDECGRSGEASAWIKVGKHHEVALTDHLALAVAGEGTSLLDRIEEALGHRLRLR